jgi:hypothetical protein
MATLGVPGTYPTISPAVAAAFSGGTILVAPGYAGNEAVSVGVSNLTFSDMRAPDQAVRMAGQNSLARLRQDRSHVKMKLVGRLESDGNMEMLCNE